VIVRSLSVVLPAHNEVDTLAEVVHQALRVGSACAPLLEVIIVDDGSRDGTAAVADALRCVDERVHVVRHPENRGYGAALRSGFQRAQHDWIFYTDTDGQFDLTELPRLLELLGGYDVVTGYRAARRDGYLRRAFGVTFNAAANHLLGVHVRDVNCAFKVYPRRLFDGLELCARGALIDAEMLGAARIAGLRVGELAVTHRPRRRGEQSGARLDVISRAVFELGALVLRRASERRTRRQALVTPL
jgi:glycosyltransferase involved in cell wall biosynthesis